MSRHCSWAFGALWLAASAVLAADGVAVKVGQEVQLTDLSNNSPTSWEWDFSYDPAVYNVDSRAQDPLWSYPQAGLWDIHLEACNFWGCTSTVKQIEVVDLCTLDLDVVLPAQTVTTDQNVESCNTITAVDSYTVEGNAAVSFHTGKTIVLGDGFSLATGATFQAVVDPLLSVP